MVFEFKLPDVGEGIHEGEIVNWLVKEGDAVKENQPILNVMTDKATVEITSPRTGRIAKILAAEGKVVKVGDVMVTIEEGAGPASTSQSPSGTPAPAGGAAAPPRPGGTAGSARDLAPPAARQAPTGTRPETPASAAHASAGVAKEEKTLFELPKDIPLGTRRIQRGSATSATAAMETPARAKTLATPSTRRMAREMGIDINKVPASGPAGRVTKDDLKGLGSGTTATRETLPAASTIASRQTAVALPRREMEERVPLRGLRKKIAEQMVRSKHTATHFTYVEEVDVTQLMHLRDAAKHSAEKAGIKITYLPFIIKATVSALKQFPIVNSSLDDSTGEVVYKKYYNVGVALDTPDGLMVPVVKDAGSKTIFQIAADIERLAEAGRNRKIALEDLKDGTFTITSLGKSGGILATPIINWPEVAIMGVHKIKETPVVNNGKIEIGHLMNLSFSFDHRVVDGAVGAQFAQALIRYLEDPKLLLLDMM